MSKLLGKRWEFLLLSAPFFQKVQVVCLSQPGKLALSEDVSASSQGSMSEHSSSGETAGIVDFLSMDNGKL